jgi:hypothetical protein
MIRQGIRNKLLKRLKEKRRFVQVLAGPPAGRQDHRGPAGYGGQQFKPKRQLLVGGQALLWKNSFPNRRRRSGRRYCAGGFRAGWVDVAKKV